ncbi:alpha-L-fucosidase [Enterococcus sp. AZ186]|uniref:alpha-L-fucosidase n=1 Tax=Enterococcus sp. AZ186 TaxID=2774632 RepID=UPI003F685864
MEWRSKMNSNVEWFKNAKYGMMIHWGLYSLLAGEYKGESSSAYAEWIQSKFQISNDEYAKLAEVFNPIYFDAEEIVSFAKECGMNYLVITTKHHDGFALYNSNVDSFNIYKATPFKRDILKEFSEACKKHNLKLGIYYSQDLDWHDPNGGGYLSNDLETAGTTWDNSWDFTQEKDFDIYYKNKVLPQIEEIMTNYGEIVTAWFDAPMTLSSEQSQEIYDTVKRLQPNCLINSRLGNGSYDYVSLGDNEIPESKQENNFEVDYNALDGFKPSEFDLYETAATMNDSWGFSYHDQKWKSPEKIFDYKTHLNYLGINYLLNVGLDGLGRIPMQSIKTLKKVAEMGGE